MFTEVKSERSLVGLTTRAFCLIPFRACGGDKDFMVSIATEEITGLAGGEEEEEGSLFDRFEAKAAGFGSSEGLFFEVPSLRVLTMAVNLKEHKETTKERTNKKGANFVQ